MEGFLVVLLIGRFYHTALGPKGLIEEYVHPGGSSQK